MTHFGDGSGYDSGSADCPGATDPLAYDPAVDGFFPDQPPADQDPAVASSEEEAAAWAVDAANDRESYEPPSYADDSDS